jgi:hypothetical protein
LGVLWQAKCGGEVMTSFKAEGSVLGTFLKGIDCLKGILMSAVLALVGLLKLYHVAAFQYLRVSTLGMCTDFGR